MKIEIFYYHKAWQCLLFAVKVSQIGKRRKLSDSLVILELITSIIYVYMKGLKEKKHQDMCLNWVLLQSQFWLNLENYRWIFLNCFLYFTQNLFNALQKNSFFETNLNKLLKIKICTHKVWKSIKTSCRATDNHI